MFEKAISNVASVATPLALIVLGGFFDFKKIKGNVKQLIIGISGRLVVIPLICVTIAILLGFRGSVLIAIFTTFAAPTAVTSFTMAKQMGGDGRPRCSDCRARHPILHPHGLSWNFHLKTVGDVLG